MKQNSYFYSNIDNDYIDKSLIKTFEMYSEKSYNHIYLINKPLSEKKYDYTINKVLIILCPDHNIKLVNLNLSEDEFDDIYLDFIEDLGHIADKYDYTKIIKRPRFWRKYIQKLNLDEFTKCVSTESNLNNFMKKNKLDLESEKRTVKLLVSLLTGSINSIEKIGEAPPKSTLEKIKQNIILFDGDQTRFIFKDNYNDKIIKIQGLAGTGKTELLLHRLKEIYVTNRDAKTVFTCQSKTLSNKLKNRITEFFNFMKVEEQIEWGERLWVMHAWGSVKDTHNLGTYGMICRKYQLPFYSAQEGSFSYACKKTLEYIKNSNIEIDPCFDYMLIDEGQDFTESFIELCSLATKNQVFVAGDIFQDIFGIQKIETNVHYLLNKCYRTDPRTLMFSHALGLALYEKPSLRFLKDSEWKACGYNFIKEDKKYIFKREPVTRFEDIDFSNISSGVGITNYDEYKTSNIINIIKNIKLNFPDVAPDDIAIVFPNPNLNYSKIDNLAIDLYEEFKYNSNLIFNTKETYPGTITISNKNNIKGLEFPFIICIADYPINKNFTDRNTLYMTLTRSFISSYLLIQNKYNTDLIESLYKGLNEINKSFMMTVDEPSESERAQQDSLIRQYNTQTSSQHEILTNIFDDLEIPSSSRSDIRNAVVVFRPNVTDYKILKDFILTLKGDCYGKRN
ncbi:DEAD/DEAH box helicase [Clostridioides difficile]|nr:DEAD/DEAH box helicase [Clostridioides difficile]